MKSGFVVSLPEKLSREGILLIATNAVFHSQSIRHIKINQRVTQHFSLKGNIINISHEGESRALD
jgi:hypothetical protein